MARLFLICGDKGLLDQLEIGPGIDIKVIKEKQIKSQLKDIDPGVRLINFSEVDLFNLVPSETLKEIDFIQINSDRFKEDALVEISKWFLEIDGKTITTFKDSDDKLEIIDFKEDVLRKHFVNFLTNKELEKEINLIRNNPDYLFDGKMYLAREEGQLKGTGVIKYLNNNEAFLHTGYGKGFGAVATLLAIRIARARKEGVSVFTGEVFRDNYLGDNHLKRFSFKKTNQTRLAACSKTKMVDLYKKTYQ